MDSEPKVVAIIPAFKSEAHVIDVLSRIPAVVSRVIVVDDCCPNGTGQLVMDKVIDQRVEVIFNKKNLGVGGAVISGLRRALESDADIFVKLDSDGQMDPEDIPRLIQPLVDLTADYTKGNRFNSLDDLQEMPKSRVVGNAALSLMSKLSTGYWTITDPTNGFFALSRGALERIKLQKLRQRWFFESDILFRLSIIRAVVADVPIKARYRDERSNLKVRKIIFEFAHRHNINFMKRIFYVYYLREWTAASFELPAGLFLFIGGTGAGLAMAVRSSLTDQAATTGQVMLAALPIILGVQFLLSVLGFDVANEPKRPLYVQHRKKAGI